MARMHGRLQVVATPIGNLADLSARAREALSGADVIAARDVATVVGAPSAAPVVPAAPTGGASPAPERPAVRAPLTGILLAIRATGSPSWPRNSVG